MPFVVLEDTHIVNVREIDEQHKELVGRINQIHEAMTLKRGKEVLGGLLDELIEYTRFHFSTEEELMTAHEYPELSRHKSEHDRLLEQVVALDRQFRSGELLLSFAIILELKGWAMRHILYSDKPLGDFLNRDTVS